MRAAQAATCPRVLATFLARVHWITTYPHGLLGIQPAMRIGSSGHLLGDEEQILLHTTTNTQGAATEEKNVLCAGVASAIASWVRRIGEAKGAIDVQLVRLKIAQAKTDEFQQCQQVPSAQAQHPLFNMRYQSHNWGVMRLPWEWLIIGMPWSRASLP
eukprot:6189019-Pleurochrysis_carterae.AAC.7